MPGRMMSPGSFRWLEWGMASNMPRSRVYDRYGQMIFTGSVVRHPGGEHPKADVRVLALSEHEATIQDVGDGEPRAVAYAELVLVHALPNRGDLPKILPVDFLLSSP